MKFSGCKRKVIMTPFSKVAVIPRTKKFSIEFANIKDNIDRSKRSKSTTYNEVVIQQGHYKKIAADMMVLNKGQTIRIKKAYKYFGPEGLASKRRGSPIPNKIPEEILSKTSNIINKKYYDFEPTFACKKLSEKK